jgi:hypothetical protein
MPLLASQRIALSEFASRGPTYRASGARSTHRPGGSSKRPLAHIGTVRLRPEWRSRLVLSSWHDQSSIYSGGARTTWAFFASLCILARSPARVVVAGARRRRTQLGGHVAPRSAASGSRRSEGIARVAASLVWPASQRWPIRQGCDARTSMDSQAFCPPRARGALQRRLAQDSHALRCRQLRCRHVGISAV